MFETEFLEDQLEYTHKRQRALKHPTAFIVCAFTNEEAGTIRYRTYPNRGLDSMRNNRVLRDCRVGENPALILSVRADGYVIIHRATIHDRVYERINRRPMFDYWNEYEDDLRRYGDSGFTQ